MIDSKIKESEFVELLNCPFCGSKASARRDGENTEVYCVGIGCYAKVKCISSDLELAKAKWNERV